MSTFDLGKANSIRISDLSQNRILPRAHTRIHLSSAVSSKGRVAPFSLIFDSNFGLPSFSCALSLCLIICSFPIQGRGPFLPKGFGDIHLLLSIGIPLSRQGKREREREGRRCCCNIPKRETVLGSAKNGSLQKSNPNCRYRTKGTF